MTAETLKLRPYARLLTMLGDQLIKNERIALVELIKNAYDADADRVDVRFEDFNPDMTHNPDSRIVVRDDGTGMTPDVVRNEWMNPAAPTKYLAKRAGRRRTPCKRRIIQGEKGIGRFAILKLGKVVTVTTRPPDSDLEARLAYDFARFDEDFVYEHDEQKKIFLDEIGIEFSQTVPTVLRGAQHGTVIEIRKLKGAWNDRVIKHLCDDVSNLTDPVSRLTHGDGKASGGFEIEIFCNGERRSVDADQVETLKALIDENAVLKIEGGFRSSGTTFAFKVNDVVHEITLQDPKIVGLWVWRQRFGRSRDNATAEHVSMSFRSESEDGGRNQTAGSGPGFTCGDFGFHFYVFDFLRGIGGRYRLKQTEKDRLKAHRIYLYRDGVRVYPYGDPDDDWLNIDVTRGTGRAGDFFSNDQIVGWIDITQEGNPDLRDKTNREGLIETGGAVRDLIFLVQLFLSYVKQVPFLRYQHKRLLRSTARLVQDGVVARSLADLKAGLEETGQKGQARDVAQIETTYGREKEYLSRRAETAEDLAGVGLSVEMASHDVMLLLNRASEIGGRLAKMTRTAGNEEIRQQVDMLVGVLQQVVGGMRDVQILFKSSRRRRKMQKIEPVLDKIHRIYETLLDQRGIRYRKDTTGGSPLVANTTDGVIMQVLINLFDNSAYWLETIDPSRREIRVTVDGARSELIFSDSGPGIDPEDLPYIFEPFYSGKGQEGRGLGLYIARQLLERHDYRIAVTDDHRNILPGANFVISFVKEDS